MPLLVRVKKDAGIHVQYKPNEGHKRQRVRCWQRLASAPSPPHLIQVMVTTLPRTLEILHHWQQQFLFKCSIDLSISLAILEKAPFSLAHGPHIHNYSTMIPLTHDISPSRRLAVSPSTLAPFAVQAVDSPGAAPAEGSRSP